MAVLMKCSGTCGKNLTWTFDPETSTLTIAGSGEMDDFNVFYCPWRFCRSNIRHIALPAGLTAIGECAFYSCTGLAKITLPEGLTKIGEFAFYYCAGLTDVVIPASVTEIGKYAFRDCPCERAVLTQRFDANVDIMSSERTVDNA